MPLSYGLAFLINSFGTAVIEIYIILIRDVIHRAHPTSMQPLSLSISLFLSAIYTKNIPINMLDDVCVCVCVRGGCLVAVAAIHFSSP